MDDAQLSRSMSAYVETFSEPDDETTSRMRDRVTAYAMAEQTRRKTRRRWLIGGLALTLCVASVGAYWIGRSGPDGAGDVLQGGQSGQRVEIPGTGVVELGAGAKLLVRGELGEDGGLELVAGEAHVTLGADAPRPIRLRSGDYELFAEDADFRVRHTGSLPVLRVERGKVRLSGPDLPASGLWLTPSQKK